MSSSAQTGLKSQSQGRVQQQPKKTNPFIFIVLGVIVLLIGGFIGYYSKKTPSAETCPVATPCPSGNACPACPVAASGDATCPPTPTPKTCPATSSSGTCPTCPACTSCISPKLARYVILQRTDSRQEFINIAEIEVYDKDGAKITSGITASLSPAYPDTNFNSGASNVLDGDINTIAHTNNSGAAYIKLDLGSDKLVSKVIIRNRMDCCQDRIVGCSLILQTADETETYKKEIKNIQMEYAFIACDNCQLNQPFNIFFPNKTDSADRKCMDSGSIWTTGYGDWTCDANNAAQRFYFKMFPNRQFQIRDNSQKRCLDTGSDPWDFRNCDDNNDNQKFVWLNTGNKRNIQQVSLGKECLDVGNSKKHWTCNQNNNNQNIALYPLI